MEKPRKWTEEEDETLYKEIKDHPQNLKACFMVVAEKTNRTIGAVANHWYTKISKNPQYCCFMLISNHHRTMNRKNGAGEECTPSIIKRILKIMGLIPTTQNERKVNTHKSKTRA